MRLVLDVGEEREDEIKQCMEVLDGLAWMIETGTVFERNPETAFRLYEFLGRNGDARAYNNAGWMLFDGALGEPDAGAAREYFALACDGGDDLAAVNMGNLYESGRLGKPDYAEAAYWYRIAWERGNMKGRYNAVNIVLTYDVGTDDEKRQAVREMEELSNEFGYPGTAFACGRAYENGIGVEKDYEKAMMYYKRGCGEEDAWCFSQLGCMYGRGLGVEADDGMALRCYIKAAELGDALGAANAGFNYENGRGCEQDTEKALKYYRMAAEAGEEHGIEGYERLRAHETGKKHQMKKTRVRFRKWERLDGMETEGEMWAGATKDPGKDEVPILVHVTDAGFLKPERNHEYAMEITGHGIDVRIYGSPEEYGKQNDWEGSLAVPAIIPCGTAPIEGDEDFAPEATILFTGTITDCFKEEDGATGTVFDAYGISSFQLDFTLLVPEGAFPEAKPGNVVGGTALLSGRLHDRNTCPVCGKYEFEGEFDICPYCGWEHDKVQEQDPESDTGANFGSLNEFREMYRKKGKAE